MTELKPCPFCGNEKAPRLATILELELCANFESENCPECYEGCGDDACMHVVICSAHDDGCGASTGWCLNEEDAIEQWNIRGNEYRCFSEGYDAAIRRMKHG